MAMLVYQRVTRSREWNPPQTQSPSCWLTQVDRETGRKKQRSATDRQRRRIILDHYLNRNINSKTIVHFSSMLRDRDEVLEEFRLFVVPALLPKTCPVLNRSKWLGCEESFRWLGLLLSHHNLLSRVMKRWKGGGRWLLKQLWKGQKLVVLTWALHD